MQPFDVAMVDNFTRYIVLLARICLPINIFLGITGNLANIIVLTRPTLIKYASSHFFLAMAINNLIGAAFVSTVDFLSMGLMININILSPVSCKLIRYFSDLLILFSSYFIVLASIDRYCVSSRSPIIRRLSDVKIARITISCIVIIFALFYINTLVLIDIDPMDQFGCAIRPKTLYHIIYAIIQTIIYAILSPCLMILFGFLTIYNTKKVQIQPTGIVTNRRTERQLTLMLLVQVMTHLILNLPVGILYLLLHFLPDNQLTSEFYFALIVSGFLCEFSYSSPFFLYIACGRSFQRELVSLFKRLFLHRFIHRIYPGARNRQVMPAVTKILSRKINE